MRSAAYAAGVTATNEFGQPVGMSLGDWTPPVFPPHESIGGRSVRLDPIRTGHATELFEAVKNGPDTLWTYLPWGPYDEAAGIAEVIDGLSGRSDWQGYAIVVDDVAVGMAWYLRIDPKGGAIEIGGILFSPALQQTTAATEALYLLIKRSFELGYRRCEWKCDDLNAPSRAAALRLGFIYEGTFRKVTHYKGRSRDTAWFAIIVDDWPALHSRFEAWLSPDNFDSDGRQLQRLEDL